MDTPLTEESVQLRQELNTINRSMCWLQELKDKIETAGLSRHDIQALASIRETLVELGHDELEPVPALEQYTPASFTDERSSVNLDVGLESISRTIIQTVKRWIRKLVEYIRNAVRWYRKNIANDAATQAKLKKFSDAISKTSTGSSELATRYVKLDEREFKAQLAEQWKKILGDSELKYTTEHLAVLGNPDAVKEINELIQHASGLTHLFGHMTKSLRAFLLEPDTAPDTFTMDTRVFDDIHSQKLAVEKATMVRPGKKVVDHHNAKRSHFANLTPAGGFRLSSELTEVTKSDYIYDTLEEAADILREIEREVEVVADTDDVVRILNRCSQSVDELQHIGAFLRQYNTTKMRMLKMISDYENYRFTVIFRRAKDNAINDAQNKVLDRIRDDIEKFLRSVMQ